MSAMSAGFDAVIDALGGARGEVARARFLMLDGSDGPARLTFTSRRWRHRTARADRWLAVIRAQAPSESADLVVWVLDGRTIRWAGGRPVDDSDLAMTGPDGEPAPILWFRASGCVPARRGLTASGVLGAAGIVDAARLRLTRRGMNRKVRLRMVVDPRMWDLPAGSAAGQTIASRWACRLKITMSGDLRPLELEAVRRWL
jgi:hypothetical protein